MEALYLVCGVRRPQLKRDPLDGRTFYPRTPMAYGGKKTEHRGPKHGRGAFYGRKAVAKRASNRRRREQDKQASGSHGSPQA
jgi:hypothetical protein